MLWLLVKKEEEKEEDEEEEPVAQGQYVAMIPVALHCMIVNWSERKQGSGPKGNKVV